MNRWSKKGILETLFKALQKEGIIKVNIEVLCLDSTSVKVHTDGTGVLKKAGNKTRNKAMEQGFTHVVPPKKNGVDPWEYDKELYKRRNEIERFFRCLKRFRRIFTRYDKLAIIFCGFIFFTLIIDSL